MIEFKNVKKVYPGNNIAVSEVNLTFNSGEFIVVIGTSGSGKTTCLRMINRMIHQSSGDIFIDGKNTKEMDEVLLRRGIGYVIQQIGLMPHQTIYDNIVTVPKLLKWPEDKMRERAKYLMSLAKMPEKYLDYYPQELSGGQQQRIGVIRALAADPNIILMDEPFGALDPITRLALQQLIKELQIKLGKSVVFVTHDMDEAISIADRIVIMDKGHVVQFDTPENILRSPSNKFVEELIGKDRLAQASFIVNTVEKVMIDNPVTTNESASVLKALEMMRNRRVDMIFVVDENNVLKGLVDIFSLEKLKNKNLKIGDIKQDVAYIKKSTVIRDAIFYIKELGYKNLPVVDDDGKLVGLVTRSSVVGAVYSGIWGDYSLDMLKEETIQTTDEEDYRLLSKKDGE